MIEAEFIAALRALPLHPGARGLADDAAVIGGYVFTTDTLVEGVHFLSGDPPGDVAWKLVATNLSDLAAKGARPVGVLLNYPLGDDDWDRAFVFGLGAALAAMDCPMIGGDTVTLPEGAPRVLTLTAVGDDAAAPPRSGAKAGDALWVTGTIGDAGAGLEIARGPGASRPSSAAILPPAKPEMHPREGGGPDCAPAFAGAHGSLAAWEENERPYLLAAYRRPQPRLAEGRLLAPMAHAMMDVSDGLLIDAARMAAASGLAVTIDLAKVPLSRAYRGFRGDDREARIAAVTAGDDYQLLFAARADVVPPAPATRVGVFADGAGLTLTDGGESVALPARLGWEHEAIGRLR